MPNPSRGPLAAPAAISEPGIGWKSADSESEAVFMSCALCGEEKPLVKSHVIPRAFYDLPPPGDQPAKILSNTPGRYPKKSLSGIYFEGKLCGDCDAGCIGVLDQHAAEKLLNGRRSQLSPFSHNHPNAYVYADANPVVIKRFAVSMLWRAALAGGPYFHRVKLGPYRDAIKKSLIEGSDLQSVDVALAEFDKNALDFFDPLSARFDGVLVWLIYANRFIFYIKASQLAMPTSLEPVTLRPGKPVITAVRRWGASKEFGIAQDLVRTNPNAFKR